MTIFDLIAKARENDCGFSITASRHGLIELRLSRGQAQAWHLLTGENLLLEDLELLFKLLLQSLEKEEREHDDH